MTSRPATPSPVAAELPATHDLPFTVKFWGTRGSIPAPGPDSVRYGGNTTCLEIRAGKRLFVIDGGTGARQFGDSLWPEGPLDATFLMTHLHLDHVQGFPFFGPFHGPNNRFELWSAEHSGMDLQGIMGRMFQQPAFPVTLDMLRAKLDFRRVTPGAPLEFGDLHVKSKMLRHPGGSVGYRLEFGGRVYAHCSDWEHPEDGSLDQDLLDLIAGADLLSIDATYTDDEYEGRKGPLRHGWGHSTHTIALQHADEAKVKNTLLFHHDPARTDDELDAIAATLLAGRSNVRFVREGEKFAVGTGLDKQ